MIPTLSILALVLTAAPSPPPQDTAAPDDGRDLILRALEADHGDLPALVERRRIRVLVPFDRTRFFVDAGQLRGMTYEAFREYESFLNTELRVRPEVSVVFVPVALELVIPWLLAGYGDVAAAGLTVTPERASRVAFTRPLATGIEEIVVTGPDAAPLDRLEDLAGRTVHVTAGSSYVEHLDALSRRLEAGGRRPIQVVETEWFLSTEDVLEMVHAGIFDVSVADRHLAELWASVLPDLRPRPDLVVAKSGAIAWAVRPSCPELRASLDTFVEQARQGTLLGNVLIKRYLGTERWVRDPTDAKERARLDRYVALFREYGEQYGFDWLLLAAQGYQESRLDESVKSHAGAVGLMQVLPSTGRDLGFHDLTDVDQNVHAGAQYLARMRERALRTGTPTPAAAANFALASYNAGPTRVSRWRRKAAERGLDPDRWFGSVERIAREEIGNEPIRYVANINKYYVAYRMLYGLETERRALRDR